MKLLKAIHLLDIYTFQWCSEHSRKQLLINSARGISKTADGHLYLLFAISLAVAEQWHLLKLYLLAFLVERSLYFVLKNQLKRNRPQQTIPGFISIIQPSDQFSFPSGHTSAAFLFCTLTITLVPVFTAILITWAICVAASRVILGVHFPSDTVAGAFLGLAVAQGALYFL